MEKALSVTDIRALFYIVLWKLIALYLRVFEGHDYRFVAKISLN